jgi:hypothetical protein
MHRRRILLVIAALAFVWGLAISLTGGFAIGSPWGRFSSRNPTRAMLVAAVCSFWYFSRYNRRWREDVGPLTRVPWPSVAAGTASVVALAIGVHWGTYIAGGADASGYVSQAEMWRRGILTTHAAEWTEKAPWQDAAWTSAPLGYRPSPISPILVPTYSPGLPILMAAFHTVAGRTAVYYVVPLLGAVAVWTTYLIGRRLAGEWAGVVASVLLLSSPTFLFQQVLPMSDVPAAAFWALALLFAVRTATRDAVFAGLAASLAIITRPNLVPLAAVVALIILLEPSLRLRRLFLFACAVAPSVIMIGVLNWYWHGSPLESGYGSLQSIYSAERIWPNLTRYAARMWNVETPVILLSFLAPWTLPRGKGDAVRVWLLAVLFPVAVLALYLPYLIFDEWWYTRFLLPAYPAMFVASAGVMMAASRRVRNPALAFGIILAVTGLAVWHGFTFEGGPWGMRNAEQRYVRTAEYVRRLPPRSVFISLNHSGALRYYTGRDVLRWEVLEPQSLDTAVKYLRDRGYNVYLVADAFEEDAFKTRFADERTVSELVRLVPVQIGVVRVYPLGGTGELPLPPALSQMR